MNNESFNFFSLAKKLKNGKGKNYTHKKSRALPGFNSTTKLAFKRS
jgi:hypothetical protein